MASRCMPEITAAATSAVPTQSPHGAHVPAEQATDAALLVDLGLARGGVEAHGLVGAVVADHVTQPAADAFVGIHLGDDVHGLMCSAGSTMNARPSPTSS